MVDALQDKVFGDFNFRRSLPQLFPFVTNVHYCKIFSDPVSGISPTISLKRFSLAGMVLTHTMNFVLKWFAET